MNRYVVRDADERPVASFAIPIDAVMSRSFNEPHPGAWSVLDTETGYVSRSAA